MTLGIAPKGVSETSGQSEKRTYHSSQGARIGTKKLFLTTSQPHH